MHFKKNCTPPALLLTQDQSNYLNSLKSSYQTPHHTPPETIGPIQKHEILHAIKNLAHNKAPGSDLLTNEMLKLNAESYLEMLYYLFNSCWYRNNFPEEWGDVVITPIHKNGDFSNLDNFRPISLVQNLSKLYMSIIQKRLDPSFSNCVPRNPRVPPRDFWGSVNILLNLLHNVNKI